MSGFSLGSHQVLESSLNFATSVSDIDDDDGDDGEAEDESIRTCSITDHILGFADALISESETEYWIAAIRDQRLDLSLLTAVLQHCFEVAWDKLRQPFICTVL